MANLFNAKAFLSARWRARRDGLPVVPILELTGAFHVVR
jgi:hypothetical protein